MADQAPFAPRPLDFEDDPAWWRRDRSREDAFSANPFAPSSISTLGPPGGSHSGEIRNPPPRPGDPLLGTSGLEGLAADIGKPDASWMERLIAAAGIVVGTTQGKIRRGSQGKPLPENEGIPRAQRPGIKERGLTVAEQRQAAGKELPTERGPARSSGRPLRPSPAELLLKSVSN